MQVPSRRQLHPGNAAEHPGTCIKGRGGVWSWGVGVAPRQQATQQTGGRRMDKVVRIGMGVGVRIRTRMGIGRWLANMLYVLSTPDCDIAVYERHLLWRTRRVRQKQVDFYWSEPGHAGVVPCVATWLFRMEVARWFAPPLIVWRTETMVQVYLPGQIGSFERYRSFGSEHAARQDFAAHRSAVRAALVGESCPPWQREKQASD